MRLRALLLCACALSAPGLSSAQSLSSKLDTMPEASRSKLMTALVQRSGFACTAVQRTFLQGKLEQSTIWNVSCGGKQQYGLVLSDGGNNDTRVMTCEQLRTLGAPACFKKL